ncbi:MAG: hypothetical protein GWO02_12260, partial [Gammaproteobacteria bacterium]|nr:hypothetical protein [Gammaproteobacteria bacterium]
MVRAQERFAQSGGRSPLETMWFPKPAGLGDVRVESAGQSADPREWLFGLLHAEHAVEWRERVGVVSPADGSAKASTRLLCCGGWVLKTNVDSARAAEDELRDNVRAAADLARRARLWHPHKIWALYRVEGLYYPLSATP